MYTIDAQGIDFLVAVVYLEKINNLGHGAMSRLISTCDTRSRSDFNLWCNVFVDWSETVSGKS